MNQPRTNQFNGVFPKWSRTFAEFGEFSETDKSMKHELGSIEDPISHTCLPGAVVACRSLTQEVAGSSSFNILNFLSLNSLNSVKNI